MKIAIVGAGGLGRAVLESTHADVVFVDDHLVGSNVNGFLVVGGFKLLSEAGFLSVYNIVVAIGDCKIRGKIYRKVRMSGGRFASVVDRSACVSDTDTRVGEGAIIMPFALIGPNVRIGDYCIINNRATIAHDSRIGNGVNVSDGASLLNEIGDEAFIGLHVCGKPRIKIGARAIVGAGSVLTKDVPPDTTVAGVPARIIAHRGTHG